MSIFQDEQKAIEFLEKICWPDGPVCPCGKSDYTAREGEPYREGLRRCRSCKNDFTVRGATIFAGSRTPIHKWLRAVVLVCRVGGISNAKLSDDIGIHRNSASSVRDVIERAKKCQLAPLVAALGRRVASPLRADPTVEITQDQLLNALLSSGEPPMPSAAQPPSEDMTQNGDAIEAPS